MRAMSAAVEEPKHSEFEVIEGRLKSFLNQLQAEFKILDRIVYKNKNQHRRCSYFQYLLKVRKDLRRLQWANMEEIFTAAFQVISGTRPRQKVQLLESLKRRRCDGGKYNFLERLLGIARLLSDVFREYYPTKAHVISLECVWHTDKYVLVEGMNEEETQRQEKDIGKDASPGPFKIEYQTVEVVLGDMDPHHGSEEGAANMKEENTKLVSGSGLKSTGENLVEVDSDIASPPAKSIVSSESGLLVRSSPCSNPSPIKTEPRNKVAFVTVKGHTRSTVTDSGIHTKGMDKPEISNDPTSVADKEDTFFNLLTGGCSNSSLF